MGRHPIHWALFNGEREFGVTIHEMKSDVDGGNIYWQEKICVGKGASFYQVRERLMALREDLFKAYCMVGENKIEFVKAKEIDLELCGKGDAVVV